MRSIVAQDPPGAGDTGWWKGILGGLFGWLPSGDAVVDWIIKGPGGVVIACAVGAMVVLWLWRDTRIRIVMFVVAGACVGIFLYKGGAFG